MGVIINRPMDQKLADLSGDFALGDLSDVPVFTGGPVQDKQLILSAWETSVEEGAFKLYFGLDPEKAAELKRSLDNVQLRAFVGYAASECVGFKHRRDAAPARLPHSRCGHSAGW
jgi:putative transcriptional regulator